MEEIQEEYQTQIIKGKRTKRSRPSSPFALQMVSSSSSTVDAGAGDYSGGFDRYSVSSSAGGGVTGSSTEDDDHDMANCLILLAQGQREINRCENFFTPVREKVVAATAVESLCVYQCKTCDRCFPSFQALGGHRASHKKPKNNNNTIYGEENDGQFILSLQMSSSRPPPVMATGNVKASKVHECSICRAEFSSGQALGGHMRRHRTVTTVVANGGGTTSGKGLKNLMIKKERNVLELDLNLPAPEDDRHRAVSAVFSASPLVDCHY